MLQKLRCTEGQLGCENSVFFLFVGLALTDLARNRPKECAIVTAPCIFEENTSGCRYPDEMTRWQNALYSLD